MGDAQQLKHKDHVTSKIMRNVAKHTMEENAVAFKKAFAIIESKDPNKQAIQEIQQLLGGFSPEIKMTFLFHYYAWR